MVELTISTMNTGLYEPLIYLTVSVLLVACAAYLVRHYFETRQKLTLLFFALFAVSSVCFFVDFLTVAEILYFDINLTLEYTFLIGAAIISIIGLVMIEVKELYTLPAFVAVVAFFHYTVMDLNRIQVVNLIQVFSCFSTGQWIGNPWYITLETMFPNFAAYRQLSTNLLNLYFDPLAILFPSIALNIFALYLFAIVLPTTALFYYLAWRNRSGRSLGFALGLTTYIILGVMIALGVTATRSLTGNGLMLIASVFLAVGILGVFDRLIKKGKPQKEQVKKEKT